MTHNKQLQNHLNCIRLASREKDEHELVSYFIIEHKEFYKRDIFKLVKRSYKILGCNESYVND